MSAAEPRYARTVVVLVAVIGVALSLFQLYTAGVKPLNLFYQRGIHLMLILVLSFLIYPAFRRKDGRRHALSWPLDVLFIGGALLSGLYLTLNLDSIIQRAGFWNSTDIAVGVVAIITLLEACRRVVGVTISIVGILFIAYAMAGPRGALPWLANALPGILAHRGYQVERVVAQLYLGQEGIYGLPLGVAATFIYVFVLFGAFLEVTGAGRFFIDIAYALTGRQRGGPAKAAVIASGLTGSISGSAIANVVTTGAFTIPLMKELGYTPEEAGAVEAAASTGGQIMPPIMGAGAFLIAEYTRVPYIEIVKLSIFPAILYFMTVWLFVDIVAAKRGMRGIPSEQLPRLKKVLRGGWHFLPPLVVLIYFLLLNISPARVGFIAIISILAMAIARNVIQRFFLPPKALQQEAALDRIDEAVTGAAAEAAELGGRLPEARAAADVPTVEPAPEAPPAPEGAPAGWLGGLKWGARSLVTALEMGARNALPVSLACALAGVVVGVVGLTGLGLKFSALMLSFAGGNILLALVLVLLASLVLGMGLPVTASYIVLIVLTGPALANEFGIPLVIAHLVVFWYSQDSNVTPPVALAAFAGAGIARADPMRTGVLAWKYAKGLYLIPMFMVFNPQIITGGPFLLVVWNMLIALVALAAFAAALEGFMFTWMHPFSRLLAGAGLVCIFWPSFTIEVVGMALMLAVLGINFTRMRRGRELSDVAA